MVGRTNTGGGGSGGTLVVTGVVGSTVTASKDGKTYSRTINSGGTATFKGLASGTWTVTMSNGTKTATRTVTIDADYALTMAYFSATISITYPASSTCTVTDSSGATVASDSNTTTSAKTWTATVGATGTYTVTATDGSQSTSKSVSITTEGQVESVTLSFDLIIYSSDSGAWENDYQLSKISSTTGTDTLSNSTKPPYFGGTQACGARLNNVVDLTEYSQLVIDCAYTGNQWYALGLILNSSTYYATNWIDAPGTDGMLAYLKGDAAFSRTVKTLDISSLSGNHVLKLEYYSDNSSKFSIYDLRLKK